MLNLLTLAIDTEKTSNEENCNWPRKTISFKRTWPSLVSLMSPAPDTSLQNESGTRRIFVEVFTTKRKCAVKRRKRFVEDKRCGKRRHDEEGLHFHCSTRTKTGAKDTLQTFGSIDVHLQGLQGCNDISLPLCEHRHGRHSDLWLGMEND